MNDSNTCVTSVDKSLSEVLGFYFDFQDDFGSLALAAFFRGTRCLDLSDVAASCGLRTL